MAEKRMAGISDVGDDGYHHLVVAIMVDVKLGVDGQQLFGATVQVELAGRVGATLVQ